LRRKQEGRKENSQSASETGGKGGDSNKHDEDDIYRRNDSKGISPPAPLSLPRLERKSKEEGATHNSVTKLTTYT
jgi:hypothetical protein